jgi:hypothetical protein
VLTESASVSWAFTATRQAWARMDGVPRSPPTDLVVVQTGLVLDLLQAFFDPPSRSGGSGRVEQG